MNSTHHALDPKLDRPGTGPAVATLDFRSIFVLALSFRLFAALFVKPGGSLAAAGQDFFIYRDFAAHLLHGRWPYVDLWFEYPPLFPWLNVGIYWLSLHLPGWPTEITWYQIGLSLLLVACDAGSLVALHRIGRRLWGDHGAIRCVVVYALLFFPVYVIVNWFDPLPLVFLLWGVERLTAGRAAATGVFLALGVLAKLIPGVAGLVALRVFPDWRSRLRLIVAGGATIVAGFVPFLVLGPAATLAAIRTMATRSSYLTVWALLEGYFGLGFLPDTHLRASVDAAAFQMHAPTLPWPIVQATQVGLLVGLLLLRTAWKAPRVQVAAVGLALHVFFLFSPGFSPQWTLYLLPFVVLLLPGHRGIVYALLLTANVFLEWPVAFVVFPTERWLLVVTVLSRTALWIVLAFEYLAVLRPEVAAVWESFLGRARPLAVAGIGVAVVVILIRLAGALPAQGVHPGVVATIRPLSVPGEAIVVSSRAAFYQLVAYFPRGSVYWAEDPEWQDETTFQELVARLAADHPQVWVVLDHANGDDDRRARLEGAFDHLGSRSTDRWHEFYHVLGYVMPGFPVNDATVATEPARVEFGNTLRLDDVALVRGHADPGEPVRLALHWHALATSATNLSVFVHLLDTTGEIVVQADRPLLRLGVPTTRWNPGDAVWEFYDIWIPAAESNRVATVRIGLYDPTNGQRLPLDGGGDAVDLPFTALVTSSAR